MQIPHPIITLDKACCVNICTLFRSQQGVTVKRSYTSKNKESLTLPCFLLYEASCHSGVLHALSNKTVHKPQQLVPSPLSARLVLAKAIDFADRTFFSLESASCCCNVHSQCCFIIPESKNSKKALISSKCNVSNALNQMFARVLKFYFTGNVKVVWLCSDLE